MEKKKYKRKKSMNKTMKVLKEIKKRVPNIIFKAQNLYNAPLERNFISNFFAINFPAVVFPEPLLPSAAILKTIFLFSFFN